MKKINLFLSALMICLALLVAGGATVPALQFSAQTLGIRTASNTDGKLSGKPLFDDEGRYAVSLNDLKKIGGTFQFFDHDWRVVYVNESENVATFWMADPYARTQFNTVEKSYDGIAKDGSNIWANGYTKTVWTGNNTETELKKESDIRTFLRAESKDMITNSKYKYKNKVHYGYVEGTNEGKNAYETINVMAWAVDSTSNVTEYKNEDGSLKTTNEIKAYYGFTDDEPALWLPSVDEIMNIWDLHSNEIAWTESTTSNRAWLRTPDLGNREKAQPSESCYAMTVRFDAKNGFNYKEDDIKVSLGVRPAIHLDITKIAEEYQEYLENAGNGNGDWFNDTWLKVLFIVVCVLGLVGVGLVIVAVIAKSRQNQAN